MKVLRREFKDSDFEKVRDFLIESYNIESSNWYIERWNWCKYFDGFWLETYDQWVTSVGIWVDENEEITAVVCSEGENDGDVFFLLRDMKYGENFINIMLDFAEENLSVYKDGFMQLYPRVNNICKGVFSEVLKKRGYAYSGKFETDSILTIENRYCVNLPEGFRLKEASYYSPELRAQAHGRAFNNELSDIPARMDERTRAYTGIVQSPDYNKSLDLCTVDDKGEIASFATVWYDPKNSIGILEPVGTILKYRRCGLGRAVIYEGINRLKKLGVKKVHVGSNQEFYKAIGFRSEAKTEIWERKQG